MKNKLTIIRQLDKIADYVYQVPYDELTDYLKGIRDMINLLNGEEQGEIPLCDTVLEVLQDFEHGIVEIGYTDLEITETDTQN